MSEATSLPIGWARVRVDDAITAPVVYGILQPGPNLDDGVPYVRPTEIENDIIQVDELRRTSTAIAKRYERSRIDSDDILLSIVGTIGKVALVPPTIAGGNITQSSARLRVDRRIAEPRYVAWALRSPHLRNQFDRVRLGTAVPRLNISHVRDLELPIAPLNEQRRIVAKIEELFSDLDAAVAALTRAKANLKRYRAAVLKAAVEGQLTEAWRAEHPDVEPADKLLGRILAQRRQKWEAAQQAKFAAAGKPPPQNWRAKYVEPKPPDTTGWPELPDGWCWVSVDQLLTEPTCNGISIKGTDSPPGVPALRLNSMTANGFDFSQRRYIPISDELATALAVKPGDIFVSRGNGSLHLVGRAVHAQNPHELIVFPDTMIRVRIVESDVLRKFVNHAWAARVIRRQVEKRARTTAGIYKISQRDVEAFALPMPPALEQEQVVAEVDESMTLISVAEHQVDDALFRAARLRQSVLKQAFEGKLVAQDPADEPADALIKRVSRRSPQASDSGAARPQNAKRRRKFHSPQSKETT